MGNKGQIDNIFCFNNYNSLNLQISADPWKHISSISFPAVEYIGKTKINTNNKQNVDCGRSVFTLLSNLSFKTKSQNSISEKS